MEEEDKKIFFESLPMNESKTDIETKYKGLNNVDFRMILKMISESISSSF